MPQRDVLERGLTVATNDPRQPDDLLATDGVALVWHRRRALLAAGERLLDFPDFRLLQPADLERELLERGRGDGQRRQQLGVPIALNHLRGDRHRREPEPIADRGFDRRRQVRECADGTRQLPDADHGAGAPHPLDVTANLGVPERELQAEGHRFGVHAVRAADHRRAAMLERAIANGPGERLQVFQDDVARLAHLQGLRSIDDVRRGHPEVKPACRRPDVLGHRGRERDHVVLGGTLDVLDPRNVEPTPLADVPGGRGRHDAGVRHRVRCRSLDPQPQLVAALVAPDAAHLRVGVSRYHRSPGLDPCVLCVASILCVLGVFCINPSKAARVESRAR